jgi:hypothetical protein
MGQKLSFKQAMRARMFVQAGAVTTRQISEALGVPIETIRRAVRGDTFMNAVTPEEMRAVREVENELEQWRAGK